MIASAETHRTCDKIGDYLDILGSETRVSRVVLDELAATRERLANPRRTEIADQLGDQDDEDLIQQEDMEREYRGYIKRVPLSVYRVKRRGGKGRRQKPYEDFVTTFV